MSITIRSVATLAGVSQKTVSRVFHNQRGVTPATQAKVNAAIAQLGWTPDPTAVAFRAGRTARAEDDPPETLRVTRLLKLLTYVQASKKTAAIRAHEGISTSYWEGAMATYQEIENLLTRVIDGKSPE